MEIKLGKKMGPMEPVSPAKPDGETMHYPSVYIDDCPELADLPESGEITFKFKRAELTHTTRGEEKSARVVLDLTSVVEVEPGEEPAEDDETEEVEPADALDAAKAEVEKENEETAE